jgi:alpha-D-ribose 1-methylphosphonate 5-triphosphate synthase subunit PhnG
MNTTTPMPIGRSDLVACLAAADRDQVLGVAQRLCEGLTLTPLLPAESGLALMQWTDALMHQPFFLGEVPMSRAAVALVDAHGRRAEGGAVVMADDAELAQALATLDAVFAHRWPGAEAVDALALGGARVRADLRAQRQAMLQRTRVDFSLLAQAGDDSAEQTAAQVSP